MFIISKYVHEFEKKSYFLETIVSLKKIHEFLFFSQIAKNVQLCESCPPIFKMLAYLENS